jgi:hypothetical protein
MTDRNEELAQANFAWLQNNAYPGRGIVAGLDETGRYLVQIYWIMGRSPNSRNRVFKSDETGRLYTEAADPAHMTDPSLVIYNAMKENGPQFIVSNGDQTDTVAHFQGPSNLSASLASRIYEPDAPNFTQRITAISFLQPAVQMSILRKSVFGDGCDRLLFEYIPYPGFGHCITTYAGDGNPLPPFLGDPLIMPLQGTLKDVTQTYWDALNTNNRVSIAVKFVSMETGTSEIHIKNEYVQNT